MDREVKTEGRRVFNHGGHRVHGDGGGRMRKIPHPAASVNAVNEFLIF